MSEGGKIEIKVGVTGADEGAANISKLDKALGVFTQTEEQLAAKRAGFLSAAEAEVAEINRETAALDRAEKELNKYKTAQAGAAVAISKTGTVLKDHTNSQKKVTQGNVQMGTGMQNVGYQVQDLAVQIGSGTSAFRAMGQQLPQLLSGFGPVGIAIGTISAVALPLAGALFNTGDSAAQAGDKADAAADKFKDLTEAQAEVIKTQLDKSWEDFITTLDDQDEAVSRANIALARRKELMEAIATAQDKLDAAKVQEDLAAVDEDPNLSPAEKIAKKAAIQDQAAQAGASKEIGKVESAATDAEAEATRKQEAARVAQEKLDAIREAKQKEDAQRDALEKSEKSKAIAASQIPGRQKQLDTLEFQTALVTYNPLRDQNSKIRAQDQFAAQADALEELKNQATRTPKDAAKLKALQDRKAESAAELATREAEAKKAAEEANAAGLDADNKRKIAAEVGPRIQATADSTTRARQSQTNRGIVQEVKKTAADFISGQEKDGRKDAKSELETRQGKLSETATANQSRINAGGKTAGGLQKIADDIGNADTEREIAAVAAKINAAQGQLGAATVAALTQMLAVQQEQVKAIAILQKQLKNR